MYSNPNYYVIVLIIKYCRKPIAQNLNQNKKSPLNVFSPALATQHGYSFLHLLESARQTQLQAIHNRSLPTPAKIPAACICLTVAVLISCFNFIQG